jgi:hypothetical protein
MTAKFSEIMKQVRVSDVIETDRGWFAILEAPSVVDGNIADVYGESETEARALATLIALAMHSQYLEEALASQEEESLTREEKCR